MPDDLPTPVTISLPIGDAEALLRARGWSDCWEGGRGTRFRSWTRPGGRPRVDGGTFGTDYLWHIDEALTDVLREEARAHG